MNGVQEILAIAIAEELGCYHLSPPRLGSVVAENLPNDVVQAVLYNEKDELVNG